MTALLGMALLDVKSVLSHLDQDRFRAPRDPTLLSLTHSDPWPCSLRHPS